MKNSKLSVLIGTIVLLMAMPAFAAGEFRPPNDGYDWIQLTSGEWLKGEFIGLFYEEVEFDSEVLEDLTIDWDDVAQVVSARKFGISIDGGDTMTGSLRFDADRVIVSNASGEREIQREDLIGISLLAEREIDRWEAKVSLGLNARKGNTEFVEQNAIASFERRTPISRATIDYVGSFNETEGVLVADNHRVMGVLDRFSRSKLFWRPVNIQYYRDEFQNIRHQGTLATGLGYELWDTKKTDWYVYFSAGANYLERVSVEEGQPESTRSPSYTVGTDFETDLTSWIEYFFTYRVSFLDDESGKRQHHLVTTLSTDLIRDIDFDVSLIWDRTELPQPASDGTIPEKDDYRLAVGIGFEF
jgi:hypothetical protein